VCVFVCVCVCVYACVHVCVFASEYLCVSLSALMHSKPSNVTFGVCKCAGLDRNQTDVHLGS